MRKHRKIAGDWAGFDCRPYWVVSATMAARLGIEGSRPCAGGERSRLRSPPAASAAPDYSPSEVANTVSSVTGSARDHLKQPPGYQPGGDRCILPAAVDGRGHSAVLPHRKPDRVRAAGILAPIGDIQRQCRDAVLPAGHDQFMAG